MCEDIISEDFRGRYEDVSLIRLNTERLTVLFGLTDLHFPTFVRHGLTSSGNTPTIEFRTFARKCSNFDCFFFFLKIILPLKNDFRNVKKGGPPTSLLERTCPEEHLNPSQSGFVCEEGHSGCKSQNIAIVEN